MGRAPRSTIQEALPLQGTPVLTGAPDWAPFIVLRIACCLAGRALPSSPSHVEGGLFFPPAFPIQPNLWPCTQQALRLCFVKLSGIVSKMVCVCLCQGVEI